MIKRILVLSLGPIFKYHVHGGSQKILREVCLHLGKRGHNVIVYCPARIDNHEEFELGENVTVRPTLRFRQPFPLAYQTSPHNLSEMVNVLRREIGKSDVVYSHDSGYNMPFLFREVPTVFSLRDFFYQESLVGGLNFEGDRIIVNSCYTKRCFLDTVGEYREGLEERINFIPNGIDTEHFRKLLTGELAKKLGLEKSDLPIVYPHRHDETKGIWEVLVVASMLKRMGLSNLKILIPKYLDADISAKLSEIYPAIEKRACELNIHDNLIFLPWITYEMMPQYLSLGELSMSIGNFVESFPNASVESIACETPSISARVAAHRSVLPEDVESKADFGDVERIADLALGILTGRERIDTKMGREHVIRNFSFINMLTEYERVIVGCEKEKPLDFKEATLEEQEYILPTWCYISERHGIYNDYQYRYFNDHRLTDLLKSKGGILRKNDLSLEELNFHLINGNLIRKK